MWGDGEEKEAYKTLVDPNVFNPRTNISLFNDACSRLTPHSRMYSTLLDDIWLWAGLHVRSWLVEVEELYNFQCWRIE